MDILCGVKGIDLNPKDCYGRTPLMIACMTNNEDAVRTLLSQPTIDLFTKDDQGRSLDHYAKRNVAVIKLFIRDPYYTNIKKDVAMSTISFLGNAGGLLGLCMGFSLVSAVEWVYHFLNWLIRGCHR